MVGVCLEGWDFPECVVGGAVLNWDGLSGGLWR